MFVYQYIHGMNIRFHLLVTSDVYEFINIMLLLFLCREICWSYFIYFINFLSVLQIIESLLANKCCPSITMDQVDNTTIPQALRLLVAYLQYQIATLSTLVMSPMACCDQA